MTNDNESKIIPKGWDEATLTQKEYYGDLYKKHKYSPLAVASGKQIYKDLRYEKLSAVFGNDMEFSLHDVGMGLGHYYEYLKTNFPDRSITYSGTEVVPEFHSFCLKTYPECDFFLRDMVTEICQDRYDYVAFGGTFYHPCEMTRGDWERFIFSLLEKAFSMARKGVVFNIITQYCDFYEKELYYCNMSKLLDFVTDNLSRFFVMDHAYPLYELTMSVYKKEVCKNRFPESGYAKYFK